MVPSLSGQPVRVVVVGAGPSGICAGVRLNLDLGIDNYVVYERNPSLGGTWFDNTYPGCACDVPSHNYVFSFELNPHYTKLFSPQKEIWRYFDHVARKYDVHRHIRFQMEVVALHWDAQLSMWRVTARSTTDGKEEETLANFVIAGTGGLSRPRIPTDIAGVQTFKGSAWHSAKWDHSFDIKDKRIAVIGSGASAVQIIPEVAEVAKQVYTFQRTANWVLPQQNSEYSAFMMGVFRNIPGVLAAYRMVQFYLADLIFFNVFKQHSFLQNQARAACLHYRNSVIKDPELRKKVTPDYEVGCKRILFTDKYFPALLRPNVQLITDSIERITETGIRTKDGQEHEVDAIIYATGFLAEEYLMPIDIRGIDGLSLHDCWKAKAPQAYYGVTHAHFPNLFFCLGPNTGLGHNTILSMIEAEINYALRMIKGLTQWNIAYADVKESAQQRFNEMLQEQLKSTVWNGSCKSWYKLDDGSIGALWSGRIVDYFAATSMIHWEDYIMPKPSTTSAAARARL